MKWKGYSDDHNTWEPTDNLKCGELVKAYERALNSNQKNDKNRRNSNVESNGDGDGIQSKKKMGNEINNETVTGFDRGLEPEMILGATDNNGYLEFLMKWKNREEADLVSAAQANEKCPQIVIKFYESRVTWGHQSHDNDENRNGKA